MIPQHIVERIGEEIKLITITRECLVKPEIGNTFECAKIFGKLDHDDGAIYAHHYCIYIMCCFHKNSITITIFQKGNEQEAINYNVEQ